MRSGSSADAARILANNAELQRNWKAAIDKLKAVKPAYAVLFMNVNIASDAEGQSIDVTFPATNNFAYAVAGKPEVYDELERAITEVFGAPVTVRLMKAGEAAAGAVSAPQIAPEPASMAPSTPVRNEAPVFIPPTAPAQVRERALHAEQSGMNGSTGSAAAPVSAAVSAPVENMSAPAGFSEAPESSWDEVPVDVYDSYADEAPYDEPYGVPSDASYNAVPSSAANPPADASAPANAASVSASRSPGNGAPAIPEDSGDINGILASGFGDSVSFEQLDDAEDGESQ